MNKLVCILASLPLVSLVSLVSLAEAPRVQLTELTDLDIVDVSNRTVRLDYGMVVDSKVGGSVPAYDAQYKDWDMDFLVSFDRPIKDKTVEMFGKVNAQSLVARTMWTMIETLVLGYSVNKEWFPVELPALAKGQKIRLIKTMLGSEFSVKYDDYKLSGTYALSFLSHVEQFQAAIRNLSKDNLGATVTVETCLFDPNSSTVTNLPGATFAYRLWDGSPETSLFNAYVNRYETWPKDANRADGGHWASEDGLENAACVRSNGVLEVDADYAMPLDFQITRKRAGAVGKVSIRADLDTYPVKSLAEIPASAYGVAALAPVLSADQTQTNLYGLVCFNGQKEFRKFDNQPSDLSRLSVIFDIDYDDGRVVYVINETPMTLNGMTSLPVEPSGSKLKTAIYGSGSFYSLYGDLERSRTSLNLLFR